MVFFGWIIVNKKVRVSRFCLNSECIGSFRIIGFLYFIRGEFIRKNIIGYIRIKIIKIRFKEKEILRNCGI